MAFLRIGKYFRVGFIGKMPENRTVRIKHTYKSSAQDQSV